LRAGEDTNLRKGRKTWGGKEESQARGERRKRNNPKKKRGVTLPSETELEKGFKRQEDIAGWKSWKG